MRHCILISILSLGVPLALKAQDQNPVEKTGKTIEHGAHATGQTLEHGAQATERTVGKGLKKTGNTLEKAGHRDSSRHHVKTKHRTVEPSPSPASAPESSPAVSTAPTPLEKGPSPAPAAPALGPTPGSRERRFPTRRDRCQSARHRLSDKAGVLSYQPLWDW